MQIISSPRFSNLLRWLPRVLAIIFILFSAGYIFWLPADGNRLPRFGDRPLVNVYWGNSQFDAEVTCIRVFPIERQVSGSMNEVGLTQFARWTVEKLLQGPAKIEQDRGYFTSLPQGVTIERLDIKNNVAYIDFSPALEQGVGGSCRVVARRAQITQTPGRFPAWPGCHFSGRQDRRCLAALGGMRYTNKTRLIIKIF